MSKRLDTKALNLHHGKGCNVGLQDSLVEESDRMAAVSSFKRSSDPSRDVLVLGAEVHTSVLMRKKICRFTNVPKAQSKDQMGAKKAEEERSQGWRDGQQADSLMSAASGITSITRRRRRPVPPVVPTRARISSGHRARHVHS